MMRQNMELQQRQSSLERRNVYQKSLMAANRDQMQVLSPALLSVRYLLRFAGIRRRMPVRKSNRWCAQRRPQRLQCFSRRSRARTPMAFPST